MSSLNGCLSKDVPFLLVTAFARTCFEQFTPFHSCSNIVDVSSYGELKEAISEGKWARGPWSAR
jgi:hypothetical protein